MVFVGIVLVNMPISGRWGAIYGALAPLESTRRCLGGVPFDRHASVAACLGRWGGRQVFQTGSLLDCRGLVLFLLLLCGVVIPCKYMMSLIDMLKIVVEEEGVVTNRSWWWSVLVLVWFHFVVSPRDESSIWLMVC